MWWFLMRFYVMLCMILMVCICYCCFDNFQMLNFLSTTIFYYNPKISFFMMNLVWEYPNIKIHSKVCQINRLEIALTNHVLHLRYMNKYLVHNSISIHSGLVLTNSRYIAFRPPMAPHGPPSPLCYVHAIPFP